MKYVASSPKIYKKCMRFGLFLTSRSELSSSVFSMSFFSFAQFLKAHKGTPRLVYSNQEIEATEDTYMAMTANILV